MAAAALLLVVVFVTFGLAAGFCCSTFNALGAVGGNNFAVDKEAVATGFSLLFLAAAGDSFWTVAFVLDADEAALADEEGVGTFLVVPVDTLVFFFSGPATGATLFLLGDNADADADADDFLSLNNVVQIEPTPRRCTNQSLVLLERPVTVG